MASDLRQGVDAELTLALGIPYAVTFGRDQPIAILEAWGVVRKAAA